jgi:hypothetical protein
VQTSIVLDLVIVSAEPKKDSLKTSSDVKVDKVKSFHGGYNISRTKELAEQLNLAPDRIGRFSMKAAAKEEDTKAVIEGSAGTNVTARAQALHDGLYADLEWFDKLELLDRLGQSR